MARQYAGNVGEVGNQGTLRGLCLLVLCAGLLAHAGCASSKDGGLWYGPKVFQENPDFAGTDYAAILRAVWPAVNARGVLDCFQALSADAPRRFLLVSFDTLLLLEKGCLQYSLESEGVPLESPPTVVALGVWSDRLVLVSNAQWPGPAWTGEAWFYHMGLAVRPGRTLCAINLPLLDLPEGPRYDIMGLVQRILGACSPEPCAKEYMEVRAMTFMWTAGPRTTAASVVVDLASEQHVPRTGHTSGVKKIGAVCRLIDYAFLGDQLFVRTPSQLHLETRTDLVWPIRLPPQDCESGPLYPIPCHTWEGGGLDKFGYINEQGRVVVAQRYAAARQFYNGRGAVQDAESGKWGFVDAGGNLVIACRFDDVGFFSEGLAPARTGSMWGYIDTEGQEVIGFSFAYALNFGAGLAPVCVGTGLSDLGGLWGYIDTSGQWVIRPQFVEAYPFDKKGLAIASRDGLYGFLSRSGNFVVSPEYEYPTLGDEMLTGWRRGRSVVLGRDGVIRSVLPEEMRPLGFHQGLSRVVTGVDDRYGYVDEKGEMVIAGEYLFATCFRHGLAAVKVQREEGPRWGYLDQLGNMAIPAKFDFADGFWGALASIELNGRDGYINRRGEVVWQSPR